MRPLVSQCNPTVGVFASLFLWLESLIVMRWHWLGIVVCCRPLCLEILFSQTCWINFFPFLSSSGAADSCVAYCFWHHIWWVRLGMVGFLFSFLSGWIVWVLCRCIMVVTDELVSVYNPSTVWFRCNLCHPTLSWLCNFLWVFVWGGVHVSLPHILLRNRLPLAWMVLVASHVSRVQVPVCFVGIRIC